MKIKLSANGRITLPVAIRRRLGLKAGDVLNVAVDGDRIILTARKKRFKKAKL
jgi:AbrB family looped-hinge helix DNA binding protein